MTTPKTYLATADGYDGSRYIKAGEVFTTTAPRGSWMKPCDSDGKPTVEEAASIAADTQNRADPNYDQLSIEVLRGLCADAGIPFDGLKKADLVTALNAKAAGK